MKEITRKFLDEKCSKITLPSKEQYNGEDILFYEYLTNINGDAYRSFYIVDMTDASAAKLVQDKLYETDIPNFFMHYFSEMFYESKPNLNFENTVIFMTNGNLLYFDPEIENDFDYLRKRFVSESDLLKILNRQEILTHDNSLIPFSYNGEKQNLSRFNIIYGDNGTGKTRMINEMSSQFDVPILSNGVNENVTYRTDETRKILSQVEYETLIENYKRLWSYSIRKNIDIKDLSKFSNTELKLLIYAAKLSAFDQTNHGIVLLDDIGWGGYDDHRALNTIEYLSDLSLSGNTVVCATVNSNVKSLMCRKSYKPNLIDLN